MSVASELKAVNDALAALAGPSGVNLSDEDIARRILHCLAVEGVFHGKQPSEETQAILDALGLTVETVTTLYDNYHAARKAELRWKEFEATGGAALTGSLADMEKILHPRGRSRITTQRPAADHPLTGKTNERAVAESAEQYQMMKRNEEIVSADFERARANEWA